MVSGSDQFCENKTTEIYPDHRQTM